MSALLTTASDAGPMMSSSPLSRKHTAARGTSPSASPQPIAALDIAPRSVASHYPEPYASRMTGRVKRALGDHFELHNVGINLTLLAPGAQSALRHAHSRQDEFVYVLEGMPTLVQDDGEHALAPGMCVGFRAGSGASHHLVNRTDAPALYLEVGDRTAGDEASYPYDDLKATREDGRWRFTTKDDKPLSN